MKTLRIKNNAWVNRHKVLITEKLSAKWIQKATEEPNGNVTLRLVFHQWMKNRGIWEDFVKRRKTSMSYGGNATLIPKTYAWYFISNAFRWDVGDAYFWRDLNNLWGKYLDKLCRRGYVPYKHEPTNVGKFYRLLAKLGAEKAYIENCRILPQLNDYYDEAGYDYDTLAEYMRLGCYEDAIHDAFTWAETKQGWEYWADIMDNLCNLAEEKGE